ncbi:unnamed protein product [Meganyctiphanes norvegica]|uniref:Sushi/von Willebrand factor type A/EGF/pentraxin domain-containing 1 n=1 Tax=Meganyctiphanes norvegica TaxID=48144 RepID=A0AAV2SGH5_MEGNR
MASSSMGSNILLIITASLISQACGFVIYNNQFPVGKGGQLNLPQRSTKTGTKCIKCEWPVVQHYFQHPSNCMKFIQCSAYGPVEMDCALETVFDISLPATICDFGHRVTSCVGGEYDTVDGYCGSEPICDEGYIPDGPTTSYKNQEGTWSSSLPGCKRVTCGVPELPDNSDISGEDFQFGEKITFKCTDGYELQGEAMITCEANGAWSAPSPKCVPVSCGPPSLPPHVTPEYITPEYVIPELRIENAYGTSVTFNCEEGYEQMGGNYQVCGSEGLWMGSAPKCVDMLCGSPPVMKHSTVYKDESARPQTATYSCLLEYKLIGTNTITCQLGKWTRPNFTCELLNCNDPSIPPNGEITGKSFTVGSIVNYSCKYGYRLHGNPSIKCSLNALWIGEIPECLPVDCGKPEVPENGFVESDHTVLDSTALYYCDPGHQINGKDKRICSGNGKWSEDLPTCLRKSCGVPQQPKDGIVIGVGRMFDDQIEYACDKGYELVGNANVLCLETGYWSGTIPQCQRKSCGVAQPPKDGIVIGVGRMFDNRIEYACDKGFELVGNANALCLESGYWSGTIPQCQRKSCGVAQPPKGGTVIGVGRMFNDRIEYACDKGYELFGNANALCLETGYWSGIIPQCQLKDCGVVEELEHGSQTGVGHWYGDSIDFECNTGYKLVGATQVSCLDTGIWSAEIPMCQRVSCGPPNSHPMNTEPLPFMKFLYSDQLVYKCKANYVPKGESNLTTTCGADGKWTHAPEGCEPVSCDLPNVYPDNTVLETLGPFLYLDPLVYKCKENYIPKGEGNLSTTCGAGGKWTHVPEGCKRIEIGAE